MQRFLLFATFISFSLWAQTPQWDPNKKTICSVSITSNLQVQTLIQHLKNKNEWKEWQHQELTTFHKSGTQNQQQWFEEACESGITCDVLIVTGHFGGAFFGNKQGDAYLDAETLRELSCKKKCENILRAPSEVYLFGCNTLASKDGESRTPEEYFRVLVEHGMGEAEARRSVGLRFSDVGDSFKNYMQIAFHGNSSLYGFAAPAPRSSRTAPLFGSYLQKLGSYNAHFDRTTEARLTGKVKQANSLFGQTLKVDATQCNSLDSNDPRLRKLCDLLYGAFTAKQKLAMITELINDGLNENIIVINQYFDEVFKYSSQVEDLKQEPEFHLLMQNESLRGQLMGSLQSDSPLLFSEGFKLAHRLGFVDDQTTKELLSQKLSNWIGRDELSSEVIQDLCGKFPCLLKTVKDKSVFTSDKIYGVPTSLQSLSKEVEDQLISAHKNPGLGVYARAHALYAILGVKFPNEGSVKYVDSLLPTKTSEKDDFFWDVADFYKRITPSPKAVDYMITAVSDRNKLYPALEVLEKANLSNEQKKRLKLSREQFKHDEYLLEFIDKIID